MLGLASNAKTGLHMRKNIFSFDLFDIAFWIESDATCQHSWAHCKKWLHYLGFAPKVYQQGLYFDGHERPDVVEYRKKFLDISEHQSQMFAYAGEGLETIVLPDLHDKEKRLILVTPDESRFSSNDGNAHLDGGGPTSIMS